MHPKNGARQQHIAEREESEPCSGAGQDHVGTRHGVRDSQKHRLRGSGMSAGLLGVEFQGSLRGHGFVMACGSIVSLHLPARLDGRRGRGGNWRVRAGLVGQLSRSGTRSMPVPSCNRDP